MRKLRRCITVSLLKAKYDGENGEFYQNLAWAAYHVYLNIKYMMSPELPRYIDQRRELDSFDEIDCWTFFKCKKEDIRRFYRVLKFPERCVLSNGINMSGEEVFCRGMYELVSAEDQHNISKNMFGRDQSAQSRAFTFFIDHIYVTHFHLLTDNLEWWFENGYVEESRRAIQTKMRESNWAVFSTRKEMRSEY